MIQLRTYSHVWRDDLGCVGRCEGLEDTPGDTADAALQLRLLMGRLTYCRRAAWVD